MGGIKRVPRRHTAPQTVPWCTCKVDRQRGFIQHPNAVGEYFVHAVCLKPTRMYWAKKEMQSIAGRKA